MQELSKGKQTTRNCPIAGNGKCQGQAIKKILVRIGNRNFLKYLKTYFPFFVIYSLGFAVFGVQGLILSTNSQKKSSEF